jgi:serum/glucocorticoid-regulated kinase 2
MINEPCGSFMFTLQPPFYAQNVNVMYTKILSGELRFPSYISDQAKSLLEGVTIEHTYHSKIVAHKCYLPQLLTREPEKRLGYNGGLEVRQHPWFSDIDWNKLLKKEVEMPFKPKVRSAEDTSQIDPQFTREKPEDSLPDPSVLSDSVQGNFDGFTYVADSVLGKA